MAEELHAWFGGVGSVYDAGWPTWDEAALVQEEIEATMTFKEPNAAVPQGGEAAAREANRGAP